MTISIDKGVKYTISILRIVHFSSLLRLKFECNLFSIIEEYN